MRKVLKILPVMLLFLALIAGCAKHAPKAPSNVVVPQAVKADPAKTLGATDASVFFLNNQLGWTAINLESQQPPVSVILHTGDGGLNWVQLSSTGLSVIRQLAFADAQHGWALVTADAGNNTTHLGIMATVDGGQTWAQQWSGDIQQNGRPCQMQFLDANNGFALLGNIFMTTTDGGMHWIPGVIPGASGQTPNSFSFSDRLTGWVAQANSILHTSDGGSTWTKQWTVPDNVNGDFAHSTGTVSMVSPDSGWALFEGNAAMFKTAKLVLHTDDGGVNWSVASAYPSGDQADLQVSEAPSYTTARFAPLNATTALLAASPPTDYPVLCRTTDDGKSWATLSDGMSGVSGLPKGAWGDLSFVSDSEGWAAVITQTPVQAGSNDTVANVSLLHTMDGGKTWTAQFP
jgi:photosystem II stability/assembly factor-like uncharacterized protein